MLALDAIPPLAWLIGGGAVAALLLLALAFTGDDGKADLKRRIARVGADAAARRQAGVKPTGSVRLDRQQTSRLPLLDGVIRAFAPRPDRIRDRLARTGRNIPLGEYALANLVAGLAAWVALSLVAGLPGPIPLFGALIIGVGAPHIAIRVMGDRRVAAFVASFPDAIDLIVRGLRAGLPVTESINAVGRELPDPIGIEFRRVGDAVRMGKSLEAALWDVARRIDSPDFRFLIIAMAIQRQTGGNLAETLGNLADLLRRRRQMKLKIKALSSEARASAYIIGSLPFVMFGLIQILNPGYSSALFTDPRGIAMGLGALFMIALGGFVMFKMVNFDP